MRTILVLLLAALAAFAGDVRVVGPSLGYVCEEGSVRPVYGIPGAALVGPEIDFGAPVRVAAAANEAGYVLASIGDGGRVVLLRSGRVQPVETAISAPERIAISPGGRVAALASGDAVQILRGLPSTPGGRAAIRLTGPVTALAISDSGRVLAAADGAVWQIAAGAVTRIMPAARVAAVSFFGSSETAALIADDALYTLRGGSAVPYGEAAGAIALHASAVRRSVYVATVAEVTRVDLPTGARLSVPCDCTISALAPMNGDAVFTLNAGKREPLQLYDGGTPEPRIVFVPPMPAENGGAQ